MTRPTAIANEPQRRLRPPWFVIAILALIAVRFLHMGPVLDGPHQWRQADTGFCAYGFYKYDFNIFHPSVCWRGDYRLCALEFPLHEFITAAFYKALGPHLMICRLVTLAFFVGSAWYLLLLVRHIGGQRLAQIATLFYCAFPLSIIYSRSVHVDFSAVFFAHATLYYLLRSCDRPGLLYPILATVTGIFAWAIKSPYVFYLYLPLAWYALRQPRDLRKVLRLAVPTLIGVAAFFAWRQHTYHINTGVPDWPYVDKMAEMSDWYFGTLQQRTKPANWLWIGRNLNTTVFCGVGLAFLATGIVGVALRRPDRAFWLAWIAGIAAYVVVFFNLNLQHDYYQIPFLAISAVLMAIGFDWLEYMARKRTPVHPETLRWVAGAAIALTAGYLVWSGEAIPRAHWVDESLQRAAAILQERTPEEAMPIVSVGEISSTNYPILLYACRRIGWSLPGKRVLEPGVLDAYRHAGATHWAIIMREPVPELIVTHFALPAPYVENLGRGWWLSLIDLGKSGREPQAR